MERSENSAEVRYPPSSELYQQYPYGRQYSDYVIEKEGSRYALGRPIVSEAGEHGVYTDHHAENEY